MTRNALGRTILCLVLVAGPATGESVVIAPGAHFVRPPAAGATRRITVQVDPEEQARMLAANARPIEDPTKPLADAVPPPPPSPPPDAAVGSYAWYWQLVSPALGDSFGRFDKALAALSGGPDGASVASPRLQELQTLAQTWGGDILKATVGTQVSPALVLAVMAVESAGRADAVSKAGAKGLMQLIPATAQRFGVDAADPKQNIKGGVAYLDWLMKTFDRDPVMVLAAYNAGENAVTGASGVPQIPETRDYVPKVLAAWKVAQGLCMTPPDLVTDGCVFRVLTAQAN